MDMPSIHRHLWRHRAALIGELTKLSGIKSQILKKKYWEWNHKYNWDENKTTDNYTWNMIWKNFQLKITFLNSFFSWIHRVSPCSAKSSAKHPASKVTFLTRDLTSPKWQNDSLLKETLSVPFPSLTRILVESVKYATLKVWVSL